MYLQSKPRLQVDSIVTRHSRIVFSLANQSRKVTRFFIISFVEFIESGFQAGNRDNIPSWQEIEKRVI